VQRINTLQHTSEDVQHIYFVTRERHDVRRRATHQHTATDVRRRATHLFRNTSCLVMRERHHLYLTHTHTHVSCNERERRRLSHAHTSCTERKQATYCNERERRLLMREREDVQLTQREQCIFCLSLLTHDVHVSLASCVACFFRSPHVCLSACLSLCVSVCLSVYLSVCMSICLSVCLSASGICCLFRARNTASLPPHTHTLKHARHSQRTSTAHFEQRYTTHGSTYSVQAR